MSTSERRPGPLFFSRAGRRLQALKLEGAVLSSETPKKAAPALPHMRALRKAEMSKEALDRLIVQELRSMKADMHAEKQRATSIEKQSKTSPFKAKGREIQRFSLSPPCGHYKISYSQIDKKLAVPQLRRSSSSPPVNDISLSPGYYSPYIRVKVHSPVPMRLQLDRDSPQSCSPHEKRFEVLPRTPAISTKHRRSPVPDLARALPRVTFLVAPVQQTPQYCVNKEMLMNDLGRIIEFEKMSSRRSLFHRESSEIEPYDVNYSQVMAKVPSPQLSKTLPKDRLPSLPLPFFMQSAFTRFALQNVNDQTIKMNCTRDSLLSPTPTSVESLRLLRK